MILIIHGSGRRKYEGKENLKAPFLHSGQDVD
jgi:hypothetical protein